MSIPKEPRQLMVNLMYLVLTALLVLNVSAEVMNAFFDLDNSFKKSMLIANEDANNTHRTIKKALSSKKNLAPAINGGIEKMNYKIDSLVDYISAIQAQLVDDTGNRNGVLDEEDYVKGKPRGTKNKDVSNRLLVNNGEGENIKSQIYRLKNDLIKIYQEVISDPEIKKAMTYKDEDIEEIIKSLEYNLPLYVESEEEIQTKSKDGKSLTWSQYKFQHMPLAAVLPILSKLQNDAETSRSMIMSKLASLTGGNNIKLNNFFPVIVPEKGYVIDGEPFKARVTIGAYSNEFAKTSSIYVNGKEVRIGADGWGDYVETANSMGPQKLNLKAKVFNPHSKERFEEFDEFEYEVGARSSTVSATKMNLFYVGVENPVDVSVAGVNSNSVKVKCEGCSLSKEGNQYVATATKPGRAKVIVSADDFPATAYEFRVKRIPDPLAKLGDGLNKGGGPMGNGEFKIQKGLDAYLKDFEFNAPCSIVGYTFTRHKKNDDPITVKNRGGKFNDKSRRLVDQARSGDHYYFDDIYAKCPGDTNGRRLPNMVFKIR